MGDVTPDSGRSYGIELIAAERRRQVESEGWAPEHDDTHRRSELSRAGACYALHAGRPWLGRVTTPSGGGDNGGRGGIVESRLMLPLPWPWEAEWWKPTGDAVRDLVKAGALIAAEIDRLQREAERDAR